MGAQAVPAALFLLLVARPWLFPVVPHGPLAQPATPSPLTSTPTGLIAAPPLARCPPAAQPARVWRLARCALWRGRQLAWVWRARSDEQLWDDGLWGELYSVRVRACVCVGWAGSVWGLPQRAQGTPGCRQLLPRRAALRLPCPAGVVSVCNALCSSAVGVLSPSRAGNKPLALSLSWAFWPPHTHPLRAPTPPHHHPLAHQHTPHPPTPAGYLQQLWLWVRPSCRLLALWRSASRQPLWRGARRQPVRPARLYTGLWSGLQPRLWRREHPGLR